MRRARNDLASGKPGFQRANSILIVRSNCFSRIIMKLSTIFVAIKFISWNEFRDNK